MATYRTPGVYVQEIATLPPSVAEVSTAIPAFIGCTANGPAKPDQGDVVPVVKRISTMLDYETFFSGAEGAAAYYSTFTVTTQTVGDPAVSRVAPSYEYRLYDSLNLYFKNGGGPCYVISVGNYSAVPDSKQFEAGLAALAKEDEPTLILLTDAIGLSAKDYYGLCRQALRQCYTLGDRFTIVDVLEPLTEFRGGIAAEHDHLKYGAAYYPSLDTTLTYAYQEDGVTISQSGQPEPNGTPQTLTSIKASNTALYSQIKSALSQQRVKLPPSPAIAGVYASVDRERGVWKAPANMSLASVIGPVTKITDAEQAGLNDDPDAGKSINAIRAFTGKGTLVWGARTLAGNDNEWRYVSVRRLFNMIEESAKKASAFAVFEPNDATTWLKVKAMIESYLYGLWQQGALAGPTPEAAYFVEVGLGKTMSVEQIQAGFLIVKIGIAAVRPAEFIILSFTHKLQQA